MNEELKKLTFYDKLMEVEKTSLKLFCEALRHHTLDSLEKEVEGMKLKRVNEIAEGYNHAVDDFLAKLKSIREANP